MRILCLYTNYQCRLIANKDILEIHRKFCNFYKNYPSVPPLNNNQNELNFTRKFFSKKDPIRKRRAKENTTFIFTRK